MEIIKSFETNGVNVRILGTSDNPIFVAKDIATAIGHSDTSKMVANVDDDEKGKNIIPTHGGSQEVLTLTEDGVYEVLMLSRKQIAKAFKKDIKNILKTIRKTGGYVAENRAIDFVDNWLPQVDQVSRNAIATVLEENRRLVLQIQENKPLVDFAEQVAESSDAIDIGTFSKILYDENIQLGRNKLFKWLKTNKILMKNNVPYQKYVDNGYFEVVENTFKTPYGTKIGFKTLITGIGQIKILEKLRKEYE